MWFTRKHTKPRMKPTLDALDERAVPAPLAGLGGLRALVAARQAQFGAPARGLGLSMRAGAAALATSPNDFPHGPGGYFRIIQTPDGPAGLRATPGPRPVGGSQAAVTTNVSGPPVATSTTDFPFGPGGYFNIFDTPGGPAGTRGGFMAPRPGQVVPDPPPGGTINA